MTLLLLSRKPAVRRSPKWPRFRRQFLLGKVCAACGGSEKLEAHHIVPFHVDPSRELDASNLIALCERKRSGLNCHLLIGHLGNYRSWNTEAKHDARTWLAKLRSRP